MPNLLLYQSSWCPYCNRVTDYLDQRGIVVPMKDTGNDPVTKQELLAINGKTQVPCLIIDGKPMLESSDIIKWFEVNYK
jgi:glutaredoxin 3